MISPLDSGWEDSAPHQPLCCWSSPSSHFKQPLCSLALKLCWVSPLQCAHLHCSRKILRERMRRVLSAFLGPPPELSLTFAAAALVASITFSLHPLGLTTKQLLFSPTPLVSNLGNAFKRHLTPTSSTYSGILNLEFRMNVVSL